MSITIRSAQIIRNGVTLQGTVRPDPTVPRSYRYWKFLVTRIADPSSENNDIWQIGEFVLKRHGQRIDYTGATASTTPGASYNGGETPAQAIDNNTGTKFCLVNSGGLSGLGWPLIVDFGATVTADSMSYFTANDGDLIRDPVDWILWGSSNGTDWDPVQWTTGYNPPLARYTETQDFGFSPAFANHLTVPTVTGGISGTSVYQAWTVPSVEVAAIPVGATAFGTNYNNHIGGIYNVTGNISDGGYQKITVEDGVNSTVFNVTNVGSNEPFEVYWN